MKKEAAGQTSVVISHGKISAEEDVLPFGRQNFNGAGKLIVGQTTASVLGELEANALERHGIFKRELRDIHIAKLAAKFLEVKLSLSYIGGAENRTVSIKLAKIVEKASGDRYHLNIGLATGFNDAPKLFQYAVKFETFDGYGIDTEQETAAMKALAEAVERWALASPQHEHCMRQARPHELNGSAFPAEHLNYFILNGDCDKEQIASKVISWVRGINWTNRKYCWLPAQLVFWKHEFPDEIKFAPRTTSGCACGATFDEAALGALLELIERDAFIVSWLKMMVPKTVSLSGIVNSNAFSPDLKAVISDILRYRFDLHILRLPTDFPVQVFCAVLRDSSGIGPAVSIGAKAGFNPSQTMLSAILESLAVYYGLRFRKTPGEVRASANESIRVHVPGLNRNGRLELWARLDMYHKIDWFLSGEEESMENIGFLATQPECPGARLKILNDFIQQNRFHLFFYSSPSANVLRNLGFLPVRAILPELAPLYLMEKSAPLHHPRLQTLPEVLGFTRKPDTWNPLPHPFP